MTELFLRTAASLTEVDKTDWDQVANPKSEAYDPFLSWDFLEALERSGAASPSQGWTPVHILIEKAERELIAAMPLYAKSHSQGEYIFDHSWADAFMRAGGRYYPKLLSAVPFTPVTGRRRLVRDGEVDPDGLKDMLLSAAVQLVRDNGLSSLHLNFLPPSEYQALGEAGLLQRQDQQFHFENPGYKSFDDFLANLSSEKRKNLRKERKRAVEGLRIEWLTGHQITSGHWDIFYRFYLDTGSRKWGTPYLNRKTFALLHERMADKILLIFAFDGDRAIAGALNLIGSDTLYGRYWGRIEERPFLHFEICYYQAMDYAIEHGLKRVEAGAQGGHKLARGYVPVSTYSAHWVAHDGLRHALEDYLEHEREAVSHDMDYLKQRTPFRKTRRAE